MAVDTPVLERRTTELTRAKTPYAVPTRSEYEAEDVHNARIKENYARLINPNNNIEDVFATATPVKEEAVVAQPVQAEPYLVQNARADAAIFRADNPINQRFVADATVVNEEDSEDLRPTAATIQYRTVDCVAEPEEQTSERFKLSKKQKTTIIALAAVIVSLIVLIIINSTVIANLNADIANLNSNIVGINSDIQYSVSNIIDKINKAQSGIDTLRGATAGVTSNVADIVYGIIG